MKSLYLGIFLSRSSLLDKHTVHGSNDQFPSTVKSIANCVRCEKYAGETRRHELAISLYIASRVQSLEAISWISAYCLHSSADGKEPEDSCIERQLFGSEEGLPFRGTLPHSPPDLITKTGKRSGTQQFDDQLHCNDFKVASFTIWRSEEKIRLTRAVA